ncbi:16S rRNA (cytosine(967)-C(5))-methyltransferase RsmB [Colwellia sp. UCD-KL20]|uniref:16S rRNA (cytosine(967)-C(5))-methyltransferase RsmB n=1 Tax=Colwellia sp. UCD-KL20 TaxID=1917165 RepID=UPI0009706032|nr:16S rRNA (cytosine(967)-C(5))-methyltransferase RsmB [Colwellia sp. UCD-KL20]
MANNKPANIRALAAKCTYAVIDQGRSLGDELPKQIAKIDIKNKGLLQEICYGVLRYLPELENEVQQLIEKPLKGKQRVFHFLMLVGVYQLKYMRIPDHAAVSETVEAANALKNRYLGGLVNGVLRNYQRKAEKKLTNTTQAELPAPIKYNHPGWFIKKIQAAYPDQWQSILIANQERPPMWLRVNQQHNSTESYLKQLNNTNIAFEYIDPKSQAIKLNQAVSVEKLPGFSQGHVSIQDGAAQQAAILLDCKEADNVLDCCAAPGGKTCHMLERVPNLANMTAIDIDENRLVRVNENLARLQLKAKVITGDAASKDWWNGNLYDKILLDAPCSGTGVIRRHPDIKWLRKANDIEKLTELQAQILKNIWSLLKPGGTLLYATCSILPEENNLQVQRFIENNNDVEHISITDNDTNVGWQILPNEHSMDGFYYAKLVKKEQ